MSNFDTLASEWDNNPRRVKLAKKAVAEIKKNVEIHQNMKVLDYGTGTGLVLLNLQSEVEHVTGMDNSQGMLDVLQKKLENAKITNVKLQKHDIDKEILPENQYDLITINMALHHIEDTNAFAKKTHKALKKGGYLCITDLVTEDGTFHENNNGVRHFGFDTQKLSEILENNDLKIEKKYIYNEIIKHDKNKKFPIFIIISKK